MDVFTDYFLRNGWHRFWEDWQVKGVGAGLLASGAVHVELASLFAVVVVMDLVTKWIALAHRYLNSQGGRDSDFLSCLAAIPEAHRAGVISSREMKYGFCAKMMIYMVLTLGGVAADHMLVMTGKTPVFAGVCIAYLAASEMVSIAENLNDAGVGAMEELVKLWKGRK